VAGGCRRGLRLGPLDPIGTTQGSGRNDDLSGLATAPRQERQKLPPPEPIRPQQLPPQSAPDRRVTQVTDTWPVFLAVVLPVCLLSWLVGIPLTKVGRRALRRRRTGAAAVMAAWLEVRDRLRDHGVAVGRDMTLRDVALAAGDVLPSRQTLHAIRRLGALVDTAAWSGVPVGGRAAGEAWREAGGCRDLAHRSVSARLAGAVSYRSLRSPR